jgi:cytochrome P450
MDGVSIPAGSRAIAFYGAANRDEREYPDPDRFDVRRSPANHLAFGTGPHVCVGVYLARMEMTALFTALARRVRRFSLGDTERALHNILRGFTRLEVAVE